MTHVSRHRHAHRCSLDAVAQVKGSDRLVAELHEDGLHRLFGGLLPGVVRDGRELYAA